MFRYTATEWNTIDYSIQQKKVQEEVAPPPTNPSETALAGDSMSVNRRSPRNHFPTTMGQTCGVMNM